MFYPGTINSDKFDRAIKDLERYLGETYSNSCQPAIMTETPATFPEPEMPTIIPDMGIERLKIDMEMTYLKNNILDKAIRQTLRNKDFYESDIHKIYKLVAGQTNKKLQ